MSIITKTEMCENVPASLPPLSFQALIGDMKRIESFSNEKIMALERRLRDAEDEAKTLGKQNEELKSSLAAKERDCKLYYDQYQNIAAEFEEFKLKVSSEEEKFKIFPKTDGEIEPAIIVFDTDSETEENHDETILFTSPELFLEPVTLEKPIPKANSTALPALSQSEESENSEEKVANMEIAPKTPILEAATLQKQTPKTTSASKKRPIATARKRARSESHAKSGAVPKKARSESVSDPKALRTPTHFKCHACPSISITKIEEFREHIRQIHPERKYLCGHCPCSTLHKSEMNRHLTKHTMVGSNDYNCKLCNISFASIWGLRSHFRFYH